MKVYTVLKTYWKAVSTLILIGGGFLIWGLYSLIGGDPTGDQGITQPEIIVILSVIFMVSVTFLFILWVRKP